MNRARWQVQEAKQRFSELVERAVQDGPQTVTRHGRDVVVVIDVARYRQLTDDGDDFKQLLRSAPDWDDPDVVRSDEPARVVDW